MPVLNKARPRFLAALGCGLVFFSSAPIPPAHAGMLSEIRDSIRSLWSRQRSSRVEAQVARARAGELGERAEATHERLERTQQLAQQATGIYHTYWLQM